LVSPFPKGLRGAGLRLGDARRGGALQGAGRGLRQHNTHARPNERGGRATDKPSRAAGTKPNHQLGRRIMAPVNPVKRSF
jgi:hypothetical protein